MTLHLLMPMKYSYSPSLGNLVKRLALCATLAFSLATGRLFADSTASLDTAWVTDRPEVLTYRTTGPEGEGRYEVTLLRTPTGLEQNIAILANGFVKIVCGQMTSDLVPEESNGQIYIQGAVAMKTACTYRGDQLRVTTTMLPGTQVFDRTIPYSGRVFDFSQLPLVARALPLRLGKDYSFQCLNPQNNTLVPFALRVLALETLAGVECLKVEQVDFEGRTLCWIEKAGSHRIFRFVQPDTGRTTELIR
jgi:hypothetical protein